MEITEVEGLLATVSDLVKKYDKRLLEQGDTYNVFQVLNVVHDEKRLHTRIIHNLLDPKGSHGQGKVFLELFINKIGCEEFNTTSVEAYKEEKLEPIDEDWSRGGSIDIAIINNNTNQAIFIENKINAEDKFKQLSRYYKSGNDQYSNFFKLFYLTLDGKPPIGHSIGDLKENKHFHCVSYEIDIINWLKECKKIAIDRPLLRETLTQYINTLKKMTGQSISDELNKEIKQKIVDKGYYIAAESISKVLWDINNQLEKKLKFIYSRDLTTTYNELYKDKIDSLSFKNNYYNNHIGIEILWKKFNIITIDISFKEGRIYHGIEDGNEENSRKITDQIKEKVLKSGDIYFPNDTNENIIIESLNKFIDEIIQIISVSDIS